MSSMPLGTAKKDCFALSTMLYAIALNPRTYTHRLFTRRYCGGMVGGNLLLIGLEMEIDIFILLIVK
jgi:hypothetical protein